MTIQLRGKKTGQNHPCPCDSGLKFKHCHNDPVKKGTVNRVANEVMVGLIIEEKVKRGLICVHGVATGEKCIDCSGPQEINLED